MRYKLQDALAEAYTSNPQLEAARAKAKAADDAVAEARGGWRPSVGISSSYGYQQQDVTAPNYGQRLSSTPMTSQVSINQPVYSGGQVSAGVRRAMALVNVARAELLGAEQQILLSGATSYLDVVRDVAGLELYRQDVAALRKLRDATKTQLAAGAVTKTDLDEVDVRLAAAQANLAAMDARLAQSRDAFERVIGRPAESLDADPTPPPIPSSEPEALELALTQSPQIRAAEANDKAAEYGVDYAVGALLPHAGLVAQYSYSTSSISTGLPIPANMGNTFVFAQVTIPLYQGGAEHAKVREAKQQRAQADLGVLDALQATRQQLNDAWVYYQSADRAFGLNRNRVAASERALAGVTEQQHAGERSIIDILNAEQEHLDAELSESSSRHDFTVAAFQVLFATGQLTAKSLALNVKAYDPQVYYKENAGKWVGF